MNAIIKSARAASLLLAIAALLLITQVSGQNHYIGVKAGYISSNISSSEDVMEDTKARNGLVAGLNYEYNFLKFFSAGAEVLYEQRGWNQEIIYTNEIGLEIGEGTIEYNYDYVSIPLKAGVILGNRLSVYANLGVVNSFSLSSEVTIPYPDGSYSKEDMTEHVNTYDIAGLIDLGGSLKFAGRFKIYLNLNYQHSFSAFNIAYFSNTELRHYSFSATTGLKYALRK